MGIGDEGSPRVRSAKEVLLMMDLSVRSAD